MTSPYSSAPSTVFEAKWEQTSGHVFRSEPHGVMAFADDFPRMPMQVVIAPAKGTPGRRSHLFGPDVSPTMRRKVLEVSSFICAKILEHCDPDQREMLTVEGFGVEDHPHAVAYAGARREGINRYTGPVLGAEAVRRTTKLITFSPDETAEIVNILDKIDRF